MIRRFAVVRHEDVSGVSGTGIVAYGVMYDDGWVALQWTSSAPAISIWPSIPAMLNVHGHDGRTVVRWIDRFTEASPDTDLSPAETYGRG